MQFADIMTLSLKTTSDNKLASLEAMLVQNYNPAACHWQIKSVELLA